MERPPTKHQDDTVDQTRTTSTTSADAIASDEGTSQKRHNWRYWFTSHDWYDWTTLAIAAFTLGGLLYYAYWAKVQGSAARSAAEAATESAEAEIAVNRAWIVPANGPQMNPATVELYWVNAGKTPAVKIRTTTELSTNWQHKFKGGCGHLAKKMVGPNSGYQLGAYLLPGSSFVMPVQNMPAKWNAQLLPNKTVTVLIHGCVWYTDVVTNQTRTTEFCYEAQRDISPISGKKETTIFPCLVAPSDPLVFH